MTDDNVLDFFEREKSVKIPAHIKNLLLFTGFDNRLSLSKMESEDVAEIEKIAREIIPNVIDEKRELEKYLGCFHGYPEGFCIFPGHRKVLLELSQFYKNFSYKKRNFGVEDNGGKRKSGDANSPEPLLLEGNPRNNRPRDVDGEKQNIYTLLTNWITNFCSRNLTYEEAAHVNKELPKLKVDIVQKDPNQCFVTCCVCLRELKIFRNQNGFWIMSNIHKHFKTHLNTYSNKKFSKNISITSSISNTINQESDSLVITDDIKQEHEMFDES